MYSILWVGKKMNLNFFNQYKRRQKERKRNIEHARHMKSTIYDDSYQNI